MKNILIIFLLAFSLTGCVSWGGKEREPRTEYEYKEVKVPVSNTPMPPETNCPPDAVRTLSGDKLQEDGEVAKAYRIALIQLRDCSALKEEVIDKYRKIAEQDQERLKDVEKTDVPTFGSAGPVVAPNSSTEPQTKIPEEEIRRQIKIENDFENIEDKFKALSDKEYEIE